MAGAADPGPCGVVVAFLAVMGAGGDYLAGPTACVRDRLAALCRGAGRGEELGVTRAALAGGAGRALC